MKTLDDRFALDPESWAERKFHEQKRLTECKFESQCRQIREARDRREAVAINPLADALKGVSV